MPIEIDTSYTPMNDYMTDYQLNEYISGTNTMTQDEINQSVSEIMSTKTNGIEGLPYQFMSSVDRRITGTKGAGVGRKYGERIFSRLPLLFLTPCEPLFMDDFDTNSQKNVIEALLGNVIDGNPITNLDGLVDGKGKYYSVDFAYAEYYNYLNTMLAAVSVYLGIYNEKISIGDNPEKAIGKIDWSNELNNSFKTFFSSEENVIFYLDGLSSVTESFSNETTESSLASLVNGFSDTAKELRFLFGKEGSVASELLNSASNVTSSITSSLSSALSGLGGGIVGSLANNGVNTVLNGGKISFPEIWSGSEFDRSYSIDIKLRSPDNDSLSIFLNILKPYCKLLCLVLPRQSSKSDGDLDPNGYTSPFLVKAYSKGLFNIDMGMITSMSVTKGAECCWNDDGLPTQIDISLTIKDLYSHMYMSSMWNSRNILGSWSTLKGVINNTSYLDFLANMAGLNIAQMEVGRRITMLYYLTQSMTAEAGSTLFNKFDQGVTRLIGKMYTIF